jgi:flagellar basal-body rod protein FlgB
MFIDRLLSGGNGPILEASVRFAAARHRLLAENIANVDTPGYLQRDLSVEKFQSMLADRIDRRDETSDGSVRFDDLGGELENETSGVLFHDGNNRSMEQLMSDSAKNALFHNMMLEMLRKQFATIELALKERVG